MSGDRPEYWPWRDVTTINDVDTRWFKCWFLDAHGNPMTQKMGFTLNYSDLKPDGVRDVLATKAIELESQGATFPEDASWV